METDPDTIPREDLDELDRWVWAEPPRETCSHCGKELEEFADLGCEYCDRRHPDYGVSP